MEWKELILFALKWNFRGNVFRAAYRDRLRDIGDGVINVIFGLICLGLLQGVIIRFLLVPFEQFVSAVYTACFKAEKLANLRRLWNAGRIN